MKEEIIEAESYEVLKKKNFSSSGSKSFLLENEEVCKIVI